MSFLLTTEQVRWTTMKWWGMFFRRIHQSMLPRMSYTSVVIFHFRSCLLLGCVHNKENVNQDGLFVLFCINFIVTQHATEKQENASRLLGVLLVVLQSPVHDSWTWLERSSHKGTNTVWTSTVSRAILNIELRAAVSGARCIMRIWMAVRKIDFKFFMN